MNIQEVIIIPFFTLLSGFASAQMPKSNSNDQLRSEIGFIYYTDKEYPTFVPVRNQLSVLGMAAFSTEQLGIGLQVSWQQLALDTLEKYEYRTRVYNYGRSTVVNLRIIPVRLYYMLFKYAKSSTQMAQDSTIDKFQLKNKFVLIESMGGMPIRIDSLKVILVNDAKF